MLKINFWFFNLTFYFTEYFILNCFYLQKKTIKKLYNYSHYIALYLNFFYSLSLFKEILNLQSQVYCFGTFFLEPKHATYFSFADFLCSEFWDLREYLTKIAVLKKRRTLTCSITVIKHGGLMLNTSSFFGDILHRARLLGNICSSVKVPIQYGQSDFLLSYLLTNQQTSEMERGIINLHYQVALFLKKRVQSSQHFLNYIKYRNLLRQRKKKGY
jgi:hypothetical protein